MSPTHYCPQCGNETGSGDRFCRACGQRLDAQPAASAAQRQEGSVAPASGSSGRRVSKRSALLAAGLLVLALLAAGGVLAFSGVLEEEDEAPQADPAAV